MKAGRFVLACLLMIVLLILMSSISPNPAAEEVSAASDYIPIKWGLLVLGNFDYGAHPPGSNAIQKTEHWIQSEGVPYDIIEDDNIQAPTDASPIGKYPLQYSNGTTRYGVFVIITNDLTGAAAVNVDYIYWAVGNGTNVVIFGDAAKYVPELLNVTAGDVSYFTDYSIKAIDYSVLKGFDDGVDEFLPGNYNFTFPYGYSEHANVTDTRGKTVWYTCKANSGKYWIGMMSTTYGSGKVFWNSNIPSSGSFLFYGTFSIAWDAFRIVAHSINFMFSQVKDLDLGLQGYKKWRGAITYRLDQDGPLGIYKPDEEALKAGWYVDIVIPALGYWISGGGLSSGIPNGYAGSPNTNAKWGIFSFVVSIQESYLTYESKNFTIYNGTANGCYDTMKVDYNENQNFADDKEYRIWENQTDPSVLGTYYWSYIDNFTEPTKLELGWWCPLRDRVEDFSWWKSMGQQGYIRYGFHGLNHEVTGNISFFSDYAIWNGSEFLLNETWIEEKFADARNELAYCLGSTGYGFEADKVLVSNGGNEYKPEVDEALFNLGWVYLTYGDNAKNEPGWFLYDGRKAAMTCGGGVGMPYDPSSFEALKDAVKTLVPIFGVYEHAWGTYNLTFDVNPSDTAYSDMFRFAHLDDSFEFWFNARYMWINTANAYYENNRIILEYKANRTLEDYVWRFPVEYNGRYFNGFSDSRHLGKISNIDEKYVYIEFTEGGNERIEATYGTNPHISRTSSYIENITETYVPKNLTLRLWNTSGTIDISVNCTRFGQPAEIKIDGIPKDFNYSSDTKISTFGVTLDGVKTVEISWSRAPPDSPTLVSPKQSSRYDPVETVSFTWQFNDPDPGDSQHAYRFQLSGANDFASPIADSGKVISSSEQVRQNLPSDVGPYYWRVTTWDNMDAEGEWSIIQTMVVDRLKVIPANPVRGRANVGESISVCFYVIREYDGTVFNGGEGTVYIRGLPAAWDELNKYWTQNVKSDSVGEEEYRVSNVTDNVYNITTTNEPLGTQRVIWDKITITITPERTAVTAGTQVQFSVTAIYAYDNKQVSQFKVNILRDGTHFATGNFTDLNDSASSHEYTTENVTETMYGLNAFSSNSVTVNWTSKPFLDLLLDWLASNMLIIVGLVETATVLSIILYRERRKLSNKSL